MRSIRRALLWTLLPSVLLLLAAAAFLVVYEVRDEIDELFDAQLMRAAYAVPGTLIATPDTRPDAEDDPNRDIVVEVRTGEGSPPTHYSPLHVALPPMRQSGFTSFSLGGEDWRMYSRRAGESTIQVAQPLNVRNEASAEIASRVALPIMLLVPVVVLTVLLLVKRGLRPLVRFTEQLDAHSPGALQTMPVATLPAELVPMANAMNDLLARLGAALDAQQIFIADATHELLTPLTALQVQVQMLERARSTERREQATRDVRAGLERCIALARQLLSLARHSAAGAPDVRETVELAAVVRSAVADVLPKAHERRIDLGVVREARCGVRADAKSLQVLLGNLLDNAIKYSPAGGRVDVVIDITNRRPVVIISDNGPGIAAADQPRVFDRFYRSSSVDADGSGLGLAIAREIAIRHGASIELSTPGRLGGLDASVVFAAGTRALVDAPQARCADV